MTPNPDEENESRKTFHRLGFFCVILGALSATRIAVELYQARGLPATTDYYLCLAYDFLMAQAACLSGIGLLRNFRWGPAVATVTATALFFTSAAALIERGKADLDLVLGLIANQDLNLWTTFGARLFLTAIHAIYWPIVAGLVYIDLQCRNGDDPEIRREKRWFWIRTGATIAVCAAVEILLHSLERKYHS